MSQLNLQIDKMDPEVKEVHGRYSDLRAFDIIHRYLGGTQEEVSIVHATKLIHDMLPDMADRDAEFQHSMFSHIVLDVAQQIPYSHSAQGYLVRLLKRLQASSKLTGRVIDEDEGWTLYANMHQFFLTTRERYGPEFEPSTSEEEQSINNNAFWARLSSAGMFQSPSYAIWTLRANLEESHSDDSYSGRISGAAVWILYAGQWLFTEIVECPRLMTPEDERCWGVGSLYTGPILGLVRWKFWHKAFVAATESSRASDESRRIAQKAVDLMDAIELASKW